MHVITRRRFLGLASVAALATLSGCAGGGAQTGQSAGSGEGASRETGKWSGLLADATAAEVDEWLEGEGPVPNDAAAAAAIPAAFNLARHQVRLNSGASMPTNGLGTYSLKGQTCIDAVKSALESGVRLIDTAYIYGNEVEVGQAVRESGVPREEVFVITKLYPSQFGNAAAAIDKALDKLGLGYVDMMLLHHPGDNDVVAYRAMEQALSEGKLRALGLSCYYIDELKAFLPQVSVKPALVQNEIHPYYQDAEVVPYIHDQGIAVQAWYPLGGRGHNDELLSDAVLVGIARAHGVSIPQVILRWNLQRGVVVIPGSSNPAHIAEDAHVYDFELSESEMAAIAALNRNEKHDWY